MHNAELVVTLAIVVLAVGFDFINGFHDTATAIATSVSTRALTPKVAIIMSASLNLLGAFLSTKVAKTVGADIVNPSLIPQTVIVAALLGAILWNLATWYFGIPSSSSHALIGGLLGSAIMYNMLHNHHIFNIVNWTNFFWKVLLWLILSPVIGFVVGFIFMIILYWVLKKMRPVLVTAIFSKAQILSAALVALNHGSNDAQKSMGIITMALLSGGFIHAFSVPAWVKISCAIAMALGTSVGGWKIIKTMGSGVAKLAPVNGFAAQTAAAAVIFTGTMLHAPVSTTHITSTAIMGVGASKRFSSVRWVVAKNIVISWIITIPTCGLVSAVIFFVLYKL
jgi:inorganic phosphate transporter, PiT family